MAKEDHLDRRAVFERVVGAGVAGALFGALGTFGVDSTAASQAGATTPTGIALTRGVRRVITGHNAQGRSYIIQDDRVTGGAFLHEFTCSGEYETWIGVLTPGCRSNLRCASGR